MSIRHLIRDSIISVLTYTGISFVYRYFEKKKGPLTRIVVFHDVPDPVWFEKMIQTLVSETNVLSPQDFSDGIRTEDKVNILITFDDGYASWVSVALPVLRAHGLSGIFFINSGLLDCAHSPKDTETFMRESLKIKPRSPLTWLDATLLLDEGHTIGGHAAMHPNLATCTEEQAQREVLLDKERIESKLGIHLSEFAYPFGTKVSVNKHAMEAVRKAGYLRAYTAISRFVHHKDETFLLPRMCIESDLSKQKLTQWLNGGYDLFDMIKK